MTIKLSVRASELPDLLDRAPTRVKYLSLDCFDTLLWRNCIAPRDVFADLPVAGGGLWPRAKAEARPAGVCGDAENRNLPLVAKGICHQLVFVEAVSHPCRAQLAARDRVPIRR